MSPLRIRVRRASPGVALALALWVGPMGSEAQEVPTRILVEGRPVPLTTGVPTLRDGRLFVPLLPIAEELRDSIQVDSARQTIQAQLRHTGETRTFLRGTGEIRRDGAVLAILPEAADVIVSTQPEGQQLPIDVLSFLLDVSVQVNIDEGTISIRRETQVLLQPQMRHRLPVALSRVDYMETLGFVGSSYGHTLGLGGRGQLYDGVLTGGVELSGGTDRTAFNFLRGFLSLERPSGQLWTGGDFTLGRAYRLLAAPARGFSLEQPMGSHHLSLFGGAALSGATVGAGQFSLRQFRTPVVGILWSNRTLLTGGRGWGYGLGGTHFAGGDRRGTLFLPQLSYRGRWNQLQLDVGLGQFRVGPEKDRRSGPDVGIDVTDSLLLRQHTLIFRASHFGTKFVTPQINDALRGRDLLSAAWSAPLLPHLNAGASVTHTRVRLGTPQSTNTYTWSAAYSHPRRYLPALSLFQTIVRGTAGNRFNNFHLDLSRTFTRWRPFFAYNRLSLPSGTAQSYTLGTSADVRRYGSLQVYQNFSSGGLRSGTLDWYPAPLWQGRLQFSGGLGYTHNPTGTPGASITKLISRLALWVRLPAEHTIQFSFQHNGYQREFRLTLGGALFSRSEQLSLAPVAQRQAAILPSRILGRLYQDNNLNGRFDPGIDSPLPRIRLWLDSSLGAVTDAGGLYRFGAVPPGVHQLRVDFATVRADLMPLNALERTVEIPARVEFTLDFSFAQTGAVAGVVWFDSNRNGVFDADESPASDIRLICSCGKDTLTTVDGSFVLGDLLPGEIYLSLDLQGLPLLYDVEPKRIQVVVVSGKQLTGLRFALLPRERPIEEKALPPQSLSPRP